MVDLDFNIKGNNEKFIRETEQIRSSIKSITIELKSASNESNGFTNILKKTFDMLGGKEALKKFVNDVVRVRGEYQQLELSFSSLLQNKGEADNLMSQMMRSAAETPFSLTELAAEAKQLIGYGVASEQVNDTLLRLGEIAAGVGAPLEQITSLYGAVMTQGSLYAEDLTKFSASGVPILQGLADILGVNTEKVNEMVAAGTIGFPEVQKVIENLTNEGGRFYGSMDEQSKTIVGEINNLRDAWDMMLNGIGESQEEMVSGAIGGIAYLVESYEQIGKILLTLVETYGVYKAACIANIVFTQSLATTQMELGLVMVKLRKAFITLTASMNLNPWVLAATAIIGLGLAMWNLADRTTAAEKAQKRFNAEQDKFNQQQEKRKQKIESLIHVIQDETETENAKTKAYEELQKYSPALTEAYSREEIANLDLAESQRICNEERDKMDYDHVVSKINTITDSIKQLKAENGKVIGTTTGGMVMTIDNTAAIKQNENELKIYKKQLEEHNRLKKEAEENKKPIEERITVAKDNLDKIREEYNKVNTLMIEERAKLEKNPFYIIPLRLELEFEGADRVLKEAQSKVQKLEEEKAKGTTYQQDLKEARKTWLDAKKKYESVSKSSKSTSSEVSDAKDKMNTAKKNYEDLGGVTDNRYEENAKRIREQQKRLEELRDKQKKDEKQAIKDLENRNAQAEIDAMGEGEEKKLAQLKFNHQKEIDELKKFKADYFQKKIDTEKAIFEANPKKNKDQSFDSSKISLNQEEEGMFNDLMEQTLKKQGNETSLHYKDLLSKYQGYSEKRLAIEDKFKKERDSLVKAGASKETLGEHDYQKEEALKAVDSEFAMREDSFKDWTDNIANLSLEELRKSLFQAEQELQRSEFLHPNDPNLAVQRSKITLLKNKVDERVRETEISPGKRSMEEWKNLYQTLNKVEKGFDEIGAAVGGTAGEIISAAGGITSSTLQMIDGIMTLATGSASAMSSTSQAASKSIQTVEKASVILAIIGAALQIATKIANMFGADYSDYNAAKENYENYVKVLDVVIGKQKELLETLTGRAAVEASQEALGWIEKQANAARTLGKERLNAGASAGSHSIGVRIKDGMSREGWNEAEKAIGTSAYNQIRDGRMTGLFDLSVEQLEKLQMEAPTFWAKLDGDVSGYLEQIIACNDKTEEMHDLLNQSLTQTSFDDVYSSFLDALSDMGTSSEEFADNFEKYMQKAILNSMLVDKYKSRINAWYEAFAKANDDDAGITTTEYENLQRDWNAIVSDAMAERNALMEQFDWSSESSSSQSSNQTGFAAMSQDTGEELNGRFTALQISNEEIKNSMLFVLGSLSSLCTTASDGNILLMEMRNLAVMSNGHLEDIAKYTKVMLGFGEKLDNIDRNTQKI
ncbi:tape measure protein [Bacteroides sp. A1-P5]|uniref:Tape measure protein n=1 Tax=Bacteroides vicugnae TaxID=3037989 RepID=A0ABU5HR64_9BACE|nr:MULTISPECIES: tape measure protein [unclassified Bacteroides]MDY7253536.1 tape measure protein [Bacteroides sp. A1-P5]MDY7258083.1 tape measure protein [Bacteroides sp. A2-P53]